MSTLDAIDISKFDTLLGKTQLCAPGNSAPTGTVLLDLCI